MTRMDLTGQLVAKLIKNGPVMLQAVLMEQCKDDSGSLPETSSAPHVAGKPEQSGLDHLRRVEKLNEMQTQNCNE